MSNEEILAGNKLIAEFMHLHLYVNTDGFTFKDNDTFEHHPIRYHYAWDWLMPVIAKCEDINPKRIREEIGLRNIFGANIEICWLACVEFIKWYNEQPK